MAEVAQRPKRVVKYKAAVFSGVLLVASLYPAAAVSAGSSSTVQCMAMEAAYSAAINSRTLVYPVVIERGWRATDLKQIVPQYRARLPLSREEFEDLSKREHLYNVDHFEPHCKWKGNPAPARMDQMDPMIVSFSDPIMSADNKLALVEVSFSHGSFGYGSMCVARARRNSWQAQCLPSWIT